MFLFRNNSQKHGKNLNLGEFKTLFLQRIIQRESTQCYSWQIV